MKGKDDGPYVLWFGPNENKNEGEQGGVRVRKHLGLGVLWLGKRPMMFEQICLGFAPHVFRTRVCFVQRHSSPLVFVLFVFLKPWGF